jgi:hypothetical protein
MAVLVLGGERNWKKTKKLISRDSGGNGKEEASKSSFPFFSVWQLSLFVLWVRIHRVCEHWVKLLRKIFIPSVLLNI